MLERPYLVMLAVFLAMFAPVIAAPQLATWTGASLAGTVAALVVLSLPVLQALIRSGQPSFGEVMRIFLCLVAAAIMVHWRPGQSAAQVMQFSLWTAAPLSVLAILAWTVTQFGKGFRWVSGIGVKSYIVMLMLVLLLAFITFEPNAERGYAVSIAFAVLANGVHCILLLQTTLESRDPLRPPQVWAVRMVEAHGLGSLLLLIAVLRPDTPLLMIAIAAPVGTLMYLMHAPISKAFRR